MEQTFVLRNTDILKRLLTVLSALPIGGGDLFEVVVRKHKEKRTLDQNAKWHSMVREISSHMNYTPEEMKCIVKYALGYYHPIKGKVETILVYDETHNMSVEQLSELIEQTYEWAASKGVVLG